MNASNSYSFDPLCGAGAKEESDAAEERLEVKLEDLDEVVKELKRYSEMNFGDEERLFIRHALMHR